MPEEDDDIHDYDENTESTSSKTQIEEYLTIQKLEEIRKVFEAHNFKLKINDFKLKVLQKFNIDLSESAIETILIKINLSKDECITWSEFISYLCLELDSKRQDDSKFSIDNPIIDHPMFVPSKHRNALVHITYCPSVLINGDIDYDDGKYISMSKDGVINFWSADLRHLRSFKDKSLTLNIRGTWVMNFVCLPDMNILVTSSTERELRFYDTTAKRFTLIMVIYLMPFCVNHMYYQYWEKSKEDHNMLICGDLGGNVRVMEFPKEDKGPFKLQVGVDPVVIKWDKVAKGKLPKMKAYNILDIHGDWVREVAYYKLLGSIVSCSSSSNAMHIGDHRGFRTSYTFVLKRGIETFCVNEDIPLVITGSLDCILRIWNPFIPDKPIFVLRGHHASIIRIFLQDEGRRVYSFDKDKVLRVWETSTHSCIQVYTDFTTNLGPSKDICAYYNPISHLFVVGGSLIGSVTCDRLVDELRFDGKTHSSKVSVVLFNRLYKCIITCGMDSNIVIWDFKTNRAKSCIRMAHMVVSMGVQEPLPITAATFNPLHQFLLTGSRDGSIKMWDFNAGICLRNMDVGKGKEVTKLIWLQSRILAMSWNFRVVEFPDSLSGKITAGKPWELRHKDDILSADCRYGQALATGTYNGDLIFWRLETGQSYRRFNVSYPTGIFKLEYLKEKDEQKRAEVESATSKSSRASSKSKKEKTRTLSDQLSLTKGKSISEQKLLEMKKVHHVQRNLAIYSLLFLNNRETLPDQATLLAAVENGMIQAWSHHPSGGYLTAFRAVHMEHDYVTNMTSDPDNEFLFTGTLTGYIKIWLLKNFCVSASVPPPEICMPLYRLQFPFLIKDRFINRAKAALKYQPLPFLLSSYKGHLKGVMYLDYIHECKVLISGGADTTARLWTLSGRYIGTLGQQKPWPNLEWGVDAESTITNFRVPPDLQRTASYTSMKVFQGAPPIATKKYVVEVDLSITEQERLEGVYGKPLEPPFLGHYHSLPEKTYKIWRNPVVDESMLKIPVFVYLKMAQWEPVPYFPVPKCIASRRKSTKSILTGMSEVTQEEGGEANKE